MDNWLFIGLLGGVLVLVTIPLIVYLRYYIWGIPLRRPRRWSDYRTFNQRFAAMLAEPIDDITPPYVTAFFEWHEALKTWKEHGCDPDYHPGPCPLPLSRLPGLTWRVSDDTGDSSYRPQVNP